MIGNPSISTGAFADRELTWQSGSFPHSTTIGSALSHRDLSATNSLEITTSLSHPERDAMGRQLGLLRGLTPNWDTYGAPAIAPGIVHLASRFLSQLIEHGVERPSVVPTSLGGVAFEWHRAAREFSIEVAPAPSEPQILVYFADRDANEEWEEDFKGLDGERLNQAFRRLVAG